MIWHNDIERARACRALLSHHPHLAKLWLPSGPTHAAKPALRSGMSAHEKNQLRLAWDVWNGGGKFNIELALGGCDGPNMRLIGEFFVAYSSAHHGNMARFICEAETRLGIPYSEYRPLELKGATDG